MYWCWLRLYDNIFHFLVRVCVFVVCFLYRVLWLGFLEVKACVFYPSRGIFLYIYLFGEITASRLCVCWCGVLKVEGARQGWLWAGSLIYRITFLPLDSSLNVLEETNIVQNCFVSHYSTYMYILGEFIRSYWKHFRSGFTAVARNSIGKWQRCWWRRQQTMNSPCISPTAERATAFRCGKRVSKYKLFHFQSCDGNWKVRI